MKNGFLMVHRVFYIPVKIPKGRYARNIIVIEFFKTNYQIDLQKIVRCQSYGRVTKFFITSLVCSSLICMNYRSGRGLYLYMLY